MGDFSSGSTAKLLIRKSMPVMLALLIQSVYNIVDSYFIAKYAQEGLTALSLFFPVQLLLTAIATGTGVGVNIIVSALDGKGAGRRVPDVVKTGFIMAAVHFFIIAAVGNLFMPAFFGLSSDTVLVQTYGICYSRIILGFSFGLFIESMATKLLQARGNMLLPMAAQISGAVINIALDYILIFGKLGVPSLGISGAAYATVIGQCVAMLITVIAAIRCYGIRGHFRWKICSRIYKEGVASIVMQSLYTLYIIGLNLILALFTEDAVTVLGIYYKLQTFFFIPMFGLQQSIVPMISFYHAAGKEQSVKEIVRYSTIFAATIMGIGMLLFLVFPQLLIGIFSENPSILSIGKWALRVISLSFIPSALIIVYTSYFQGIGDGRKSVAVTVLRQIVLLVPLAWLFHYAGLSRVWMTFPITELITLGVCVKLRKKAEMPKAVAGQKKQ